MCVWGEGVLEMSVTPLEHFPINDIYFAEGTSINILINKLPCSFLIIHFFFKRALAFLGDTGSQYRIPGNLAIKKQREEEEILAVVTRR